MMGGPGRGGFAPRMGRGGGRARRGGGQQRLMEMEVMTGGNYYGPGPGGPMPMMGAGHQLGPRPPMQPGYDFDQGPGFGGEEYDPLYDLRARNAVNPAPPPMNMKRQLPAAQISSNEPHNDCEILVMGKSEGLEMYAEILEKNVRSFGLAVDLMYPNKEIVLVDFLQHLGSRGTKFAIEVTPEHEQHRSVTVFVLQQQGKPTAHKNCPLDKAYSLLKTERTKQRREVLAKVPDTVRSALESVLCDKLITDQDYQLSIKYLIERWQKQKEYEGNPDFEPGTGILSEGQLKRKVAQILGADDDEPESNPIVQEAINNIITSSSVLNVLKNQPNTSNAPLLSPPTMPARPSFF